MIAQVVVPFQKLPKIILCFGLVYQKSSSWSRSNSVWPDSAIYWTLGNFSKLLATISLPKSLTFLGDLFIDIWRFFTGHTAQIVKMFQSGHAAHVEKWSEQIDQSKNNYKTKWRFRQNALPREREINVLLRARHDRTETSPKPVTEHQIFLYSSMPPRDPWVFISLPLSCLLWF